MSAAPTDPLTRRNGLPRAFVGLCVALGVLMGAYTVLTLISIATASTEHRSRTFAAASELNVAAGSGDVTIVGERRRDIRVEMEIQRGMWRGAWQPDVTLQPNGRNLRLASDCSVWAHIGVGDCGASFTIHVPRGTRVAIDVSSGDATVTGVAGAVTIDSSSGDVRAEDVSGSLIAGASSGDVEVERSRGSLIDVEASSGDIDVRALTAPSRLLADASSGDITITVPDVPFRVSAATDSGDENVQVRQDPDARRTIEAKASSGDLTIVRLGDDE